MQGRIGKIESLDNGEFKLAIYLGVDDARMLFGRAGETIHLSLNPVEPQLIKDPATSIGEAIGILEEVRANLKKEGEKEDGRDDGTAETDRAE